MSMRSYIVQFTEQYVNSRKNTLYMNKLYSKQSVYSGAIARLDEELCYVEEKYILKG
jgi:hypothetical protein